MTIRDDLRPLVERYGKAKVMKELTYMSERRGGKDVHTTGPLGELALQTRTHNALWRAG